MKRKNKVNNSKERNYKKILCQRKREKSIGKTKTRHIFKI